MGAVSFGIPKKLVLILRDHFSIKTFIETGTYKGKTSMWASGMFDKVFTIENSKELFDSTSEKLKKYENIRFLFGNSAVQLKNVIDEIKQPAIFWLDAHWCGSNTYGSNDPCPLLAEIITIKQSVPNHIILIDDARFFLIPPPEPQNTDLWAGVKEIMKLLNTEDKYITFISEEVIVSIPASGKKMLQPYFNEVHRKEFPKGGIISNLTYAARNVLRKWRN
jgi:hypothetical protein